MDILDIIILNYNSSKDTCDLYRELAGMNEDWGIWVIDNYHSDQERELLKSNIPEKDLILNNKNLGYAGGNNIGINLAIKSSSKYILILNPDIRIKKATIKYLISQMESDTEIGAIGPRINYRNNEDIIYSDGGFLNKEKGYHAYHLNHNKNIQEVKNPGLHLVDYVNGSCFLMSMEAFKNVGPFREDFFLYFEETEWCYRAFQKGFKCIVDSNITAFHTSSFKTEKYHYYMTRNRILMARSQKQYVLRTYGITLKMLLKEAKNNLKKLTVPNSIWLSKLKAVKDTLLK